MKLSGGSQMYLELFLFEGAAVVWGLWQLWQVRPGAKEKDADASEPETTDSSPSDSRSWHPERQHRLDDG